MKEEYHSQFFTASIHNWIPVFKDDAVKDIIVNSLRFLVKENRVVIFAFVIMSNHIHLIWQIKYPHKKENVQRDFLKFTAQKIKFYLLDKNSNWLNSFITNERDRKYRIWQDKSISIDLWSENIFDQKIEYIHNNPVVSGLCEAPEDYKYSSARFYELNEKNWNFLMHYDE